MSSDREAILAALRGAAIESEPIALGPGLAITLRPVGIGAGLECQARARRHVATLDLDESGRAAVLEERILLETLAAALAHHGLSADDLAELTAVVVAELAERLAELHAMTSLSQRGVRAADDVLKNS